MQNYRTFASLDVATGRDIVVVGANKIGKSNFLFGLRLLFDPFLQEATRQLREEDFWDGLKRPLAETDKLLISTDLVGFESDPDLLAILGDYLVAHHPVTARISFCASLVADSAAAGGVRFEHKFFGGDDPDWSLAVHDLRRRIPMDFLEALRDVESDLDSWRRSPLRPLLKRAIDAVGAKDLKKLANQIDDAQKALDALPSIKTLADKITGEMVDLVGPSHAVSMRLGTASSDPLRLLRELRVLIDNGRRAISSASLGTQNLLYVTLKNLEIAERIAEQERSHTVLGVEEPEAHLHPHVQRLLYGSLLRNDASHDQDGPSRTMILTTHSPHIVSVTPLRSIVLLKRAAGGAGSVGVSAANLSLSAAEVADVERYLDVNRGELLFSHGVLLVEGDAERFLLPTLASKLGYDLDQLGISVCAVSGTHFGIYAKVLGSEGFGIPFAILTDRDPLASGATAAGVRRARRLVEQFTGNDWATESDEDVIDAAEEFGVFLNSHTFEVDLFGNFPHSMCRALRELATTAAARNRAREWDADPATMNPSRFLADVNALGKGRFAQRCVEYISRSKRRKGPAYVGAALEYLKARLNA
jgi:putative ATP-dependent endonuclease of the OLD family